MKPITLILSGWGPYRDVEQADFSGMQQGGLFLISGATGAGKTTIFDGITFALFGEVSGSIREKDSLRSDFAHASTATYATLIFSHKKSCYRVTRNPRYDRPKLRGEGYTTEAENGELYEGDTLLAAGSILVTERIEALLGMNYRQFKQISMIAQGEFEQLLVAGSKERTQIFRDIFQTGIYDMITMQLSMKVKKLLADTEEVKHRADEITGTFRIETEEWGSQKAKKNRNYGKLAELVKLELERLEAEEKSLSEKLDELDRAYKIKIREIEGFRSGNQEIKKWEADLKRLEVLEAEQKICSEQEKELVKEYKKLPMKKEELEEQKEELRRLQEQRKKLLAWQSQKEDLIRKQEIYLAQDLAAKEKKADYEYQDDCYKKAAAGILARNLPEGQPCPVCGSLHHPTLAHITDWVPDEKQIKKIKAEYESAWKLAMEAQNEAAVLAGTLKAMEQNLVGLELTDGGHSALEQLLKTVSSLGDAIKVQEAAIQTVERGYQAKVVQLEKLKSSCAQLKLSIKTPKQKEWVDLSEQESKLMEDEKIRKRATGEKEAIRASITVNRRGLLALEGHMEEKEKLEKEYSTVRELERTANGYNGHNLVFEQYVLSVYFDAILKAANQRLLTMTGERYELYRLPISKDKRSREGMEMEVLDQYTGRRRSVKSLSGGESFKAALSLALGTSDVIQSYAGGIQVEALFVDEGFGSLDSESLQQAVSILTSLSDGNRMVGIISHVEELKEQINNHILIEKTNHGSRITVENMLYYSGNV